MHGRGRLNLRGKICFWQIYLGSGQPQTLEKSSWTSKETVRYFVNIGSVLEISNIPRFLYISSNNALLVFFFLLYCFIALPISQRDSFLRLTLTFTLGKMD